LMCVRVFLCCVVLCVGRGLASDRSPIQGALPTVQFWTGTGQET
jgi:hypothetical protein